MDFHIRTKCATCDGLGLVENPIWHDYNEAYAKHFYQHHNYTEAKHAVAYLKPPDSSPEELPCPDCDHGYLYQWITWPELIKRIGQISLDIDQ